jgi:hypothetical protein
MNDGTTYDVRIYRTEVYRGVKVTTHRVRWKAGNRERRQGFRPQPKPTVSAAPSSPRPGGERRSASLLAGPRPGNGRRPRRPGMSSPARTWT